MIFFLRNLMFYAFPIWGLDGMTIFGLVLFGRNMTSINIKNQIQYKK